MAGVHNTMYYNKIILWCKYRYGRQQAVQVSSDQNHIMLRITIEQLV